MAKPSKFAHIVYRTRRFEEMISWYKRVFEAKVQYKNSALAFLAYDDEHHRFAFGNLEVLDPAGKGAKAQSGCGCRPRGLYVCEPPRYCGHLYTPQEARHQTLLAYTPRVEPCRSTTRILTEIESSFRSIALRRRMRLTHTCVVTPFPRIPSA